MTDKTRVIDIANELDITSKDVMQACRDLDIQVKSTVSSLDSEEAGNVRSHLKAKTSSTEVVRKEVQPGAVVRRRRKKVKKKPSEAQETKAVEAEEPKKVEEPKKEAAPAKEEAPKAAPEAKEAPKKKAKAAKKVAPARIIKPATEAEPEAPVAEKAPEAKAPEAAKQAEPVQPEPVKAEEPKAAPEKEEAKAPAAEEKATEPEVKAAEKAAPAEKAPAKDEKQEAKEQEPAKDSPKEEKAEAADTKKKKKKSKKKEVTAPKVKIISRPDPAQVEREKAARAAAPSQDRQRQGRPGGRPGGGRPGGRPGGPGGRPGGGRPGGPGGRPGGGGNRPIGVGRPAGGPPPAPAPGDQQNRKRRKKDKRVVEFQRDDNARIFEKQHQGKKGKKGKRGQQQQAAPQPTTQPIKQAKRKVKVEDAIRVADLAKQMGVKAQALIKVLFNLGVMTTINQSVDFDTATVVASEFGYEIEKVGFSEDDYIIPQQEDAPESLKDRAPVVTIMGHVDHGKTSLLDAIRSSKITSGEAGGITQHIGAYDVTTPRGKIVFLDTPGHEAFTAMRARGADVTDIVILVVAADDGVMDQTREAISHSKAAGVPIIVAVNKMDKEEANPDRVMRELADHDLVPEDWGGDTIFCNVSAKTGQNLDTLLEMVLLQAEVLELTANPDKPAIGHIVEARLDKGRGPVATVLIEGGTLKQGDSFVCGVQSGKVRAMRNDKGRKVKEVGPATPVEIQGFDGVPKAGDEFVCVEDEKVARRIAQNRQIKARERQLAAETKVTLESFMATRAGEEIPVLNLVLKADVQGSLEAITDAMNKLSGDKAKVEVIHGGAGAITESDILLAAASQAIIIGFNVRPTAKIKEIADHENVDVRFYDIIYKLVSDIKDAMAGMLAPVISEKYLGQAEVRDTFSVPKIGVVAGCYVVDGELQRNAKVRLLREGVVIYTGELASLKRFKDDAKEVRKGYECGAGLERFNDIKVGDVIEAFTEVESAATLD